MASRTGKLEGTSRQSGEGGFFARLAIRVGTGPRWRGWIIAFLAGAIMSLALAPYQYVPLLAIGFTLLVWLLDGIPGGTMWQRLRAGAAIGWWLGFGYFVAGLYWVGFALLVEADKFAHFMPLAVVALPAGLALFTAATGAFACAVWRNESFARVLVLAASWSLFEWIRGHALTGFPWNLIGYAWAGDGQVQTAIMQFASVVGVYGLTFVTVALAALPASMANARSVASRSVVLLTGGAVILGLWAWGHVRLSQADAIPGQGINVRIVQPNVPQADKWAPELRARHFEKLLRLSAQPPAQTSPGPPDIIVWPEAATSFFLADDPVARGLAGSLIGPDGAIVTGTPRRGMNADGNRTVFNSVIAIARSGEVVATYDKSHLVPFGEYLPFPDLFAKIGLTKLTVDLGAFGRGAGVATVRIAGLPPFSPLICYEVIFPGKVVDAANPPSWLLNVTNDAWYGDTSGPPQHAAQARMRAVEEGLPLVRSANTGISAMFDAHGRTVAALPLNHAGVIDTPLPGTLQGTIYSRLGDIIFAICVLLASIIALYSRFDRVTQRRIP